MGDAFNSIWAFLSGLMSADVAVIVGWSCAGVASLITVASIIVKATPTLEDDSVLAKIYAVPVVGPLLSWLEAKFSLIKRKD